MRRSCSSLNSARKLPQLQVVQVLVQQVQVQQVLVEVQVQVQVLVLAVVLVTPVSLTRTPVRRPCDVCTPHA